MICFDNLTESANQIDGFCQIIETGYAFEEIFVESELYPRIMLLIS